MEVKNLDCNKNIINKVEKDSIAEELGIEKNDILLSINGEKINDVIDYRFLINDEFIQLLIEKPNGDIWEFEIEKDFDEDLGVEFINPLIDKAKFCSNKCIFCFIDQLPKGMRKTLYFKDDDSRLSFLQGNFITLTNMSEEEIERIIKYRITPINVSVHTTNESLRIEMLKNKNAGKINSYLKKFNDAGLEINCQIVLVPGINDAEELISTIKDLSQYTSSIKSVAVVPVGITKFREGLYKLKSFDRKLSKETIEIIEKLQREFLNKLGTRFVFLSDEFYIKANHELPSEDDYEGYPQIENGVGLVRSFKSEVEKFLDSNSFKSSKLNIKYKHLIFPTGELAYDLMKEISNLIMSKIPELKIDVYKIINNYFGDQITVSGLITGTDLISQLKDKEGDVIIIPRNMMKSDELIFLDDYSLEEIEKDLNKTILYTDIDGENFIKTITEGVIQ